MQEVLLELCTVGCVASTVFRGVLCDLYRVQWCALWTLLCSVV
jgi:hypothetical protein